MNIEAITLQCGNILIFPRKQYDKYRSVNNLLKKLLVATTERIYSFYENAGYMPFAFREPQFHSILCPALQDVTGTALMKVPLNRKSLVNNRRNVNKYMANWIDYMCSYGKPEEEFFIEVAHGWNNCWSLKTRGELDRKWEKAIRQIGKAKNYFWGRSLNRKCIRLSLLFVIHYTSVEMAFTSEDMKRQHEKVYGELGKEPHWDALFCAKEKYRGPFEFGKLREYYPAISAYAFVMHYK